MTKDTAKALAAAILALNSTADRKVWSNLWKELGEYLSEKQEIVEGEIYFDDGSWTARVDTSFEREPDEQDWTAELDEDLLVTIHEHCSYDFIGLHYRDCGYDYVQVLAVGEVTAADDAPPPIADGHKANFKTLEAASSQGDLALVSAIRKADQKPVALVCAMQYNSGDNTFTPVPLAVMCEGNPFEDFENPTVVRPTAAAEA